MKKNIQNLTFIYVVIKTVYILPFISKNFVGVGMKFLFQCPCYSCFTQRDWEGGERSEQES